MLDWYRRRVIARRGFTVNILFVHLKGPDDSSAGPVVWYLEMYPMYKIYFTCC